jgi:hypothetical protein
MLISSVAGLRGTPRPTLAHANQVRATSETSPDLTRTCQQDQINPSSMIRARESKATRRTGKSVAAPSDLPLPELVWKVGIAMAAVGRGDRCTTA